MNCCTGEIDVVLHSLLSCSHREAAAVGAHTDTKHFAQWEKHGRGVASRLMAKSGYVQGTGLGRQGE